MRTSPAVFGIVIAMLAPSASDAAPAVAPRPLAAPAMATSGAKRPVAINLSFLNGGEGAFLNNFKNCGGLSSSSGYAFPTILNSDGYPTATPSSPLTCTVTAMPLGTDNPEWQIGWSGTLRVVLMATPGTITVNGSKTCVVSQGSGMITLGGTNCLTRIVFATAPGSVTVQFPNSGSYNNPGNLYMVRSDEKALFDAGEIFRPVSANTLLAKLSDLKVNTIRFLDWNQVADHNSDSQWDFLNRPTSLSYQADRWEPTVFPGAPGSGVSASPISGTDVYSGVATVASTKTYVDGQVYQNIVTNANTSTTPTLSVGGGPAVVITDTAGRPLSARSIGTNQLATFVYTAKLNKWLYSPAGLASRVPVPIVTALCNKLAVNCWYQFPQLFTKASIASYTAHVRNTLSPSLKAYFEYSNELFNPGAIPFHLAYATGAARRFPDAGGFYRSEYALQYRTAMGIVTDNWAPRSTSSLVRVMPWAIYETPSSEIAGGSRLTLDASNNYCNRDGCNIVTRYDTAGQCSATNTTSGRPVDCVDAFAYAPYYNGAQLAYNDDSHNNGMSEALKAADDYASGNPTRMSAALDFVDCDVRGVPTVIYPNCGSRNGALGGTSKLTLANHAQAGSTYEKYNTLATTWGKSVLTYEGGYQAVAPSAARLSALAASGGYQTCQGGDAAACSTAIANLIAAYKNDQRFARLVYDQFKQFMANSKSTMPAWLTLGPSGGQWGMYTGKALEGPALKSYDGLKNFTTGK